MEQVEQTNEIKEAIGINAAMKTCRATVTRLHAMGLHVEAAALDKLITRVEAQNRLLEAAHEIIGGRETDEGLQTFKLGKSMGGRWFVMWINGERVPENHVPSVLAAYESLQDEKEGKDES